MFLQCEPACIDIIKTFETVLGMHKICLNGILGGDKNLRFTKEAERGIA